MEELERLQWEPAERVAEEAGRKLRTLVSHAARHVPYYRELFAGSGIRPEEIRTVADLARIPVSRKHDLRRHYPDGVVAETLPASRRQAGMTSGSTGAPSAHFLDRRMVDRWVASYLFFLGWAGAALWQTCILVCGPGSASWIERRSALEKLARRLILGEQVVRREGMRLDAREVAGIVSRLPRRRRYFVWAYASYAQRLAAQILGEGPRLPRPPEAVVCAAETLPPEGEEKIRRAFGCRVVRHYSCMEIPRIAQSCPDNPSVYHVNPQRAWVRIVDGDGRDVRSGELGRVAVTDLDNRVMPFINYDLGDVARRVDPCPCGRGLPTLGAIEGRQSEILLLPDGSAVSPGALGAFLNRRCGAMPYLWEYQLQEEAPGSYALKVVPTERFDGEFAAALERKLSAFFGAGTTVRIEVTESIATEPSGKRLIIKRASSTGSESATNRRHAGP